MSDIAENMEIVRRCSSRRHADQLALVLTAMGMRSMVAHRQGSFSLLVDHENFLRADYELTAYEVENKASQKSNAAMTQLPLFKPRFENVLVYWAVMLFFFAAIRQDFFGIDWVEIGAAKSALIREGEIWRTVTALTLHADGAHLIANLVFGTLIGMLLAQVSGFGAAWLGMISLGAVGNLANALVQSPAHNSIGASTGIFAGLGLLTALRQDWRTRGRGFQLRAWAPLASGITMLAFLGFSTDGRTDTMAHVMGFLAGLGGGWLLSKTNLKKLLVQENQTKFASASVFVIFISWMMAISFT